MIFLSAQPDEKYFIWQLEVQLHNFNKLNIAPEDIQVLIGFNPLKGLSTDFRRFMTNNKQASFFAYPDTRGEVFYPSSLRPHIIKKHFKRFPDLNNKTLFYHDSDIIFREVPDFKKLIRDEIWYVSNTRSYLDSKYLNSKGNGLLENMCDIVGIPVGTVIKNDINAGGAQYVLKNCSYEFWDKVELDCQKLYFILNIYEQLNTKILDLNPKNKIPIQAWCADMWSLLWNAWKFGYSTKIHKELEFCWPQQNIGRWHETKIYHDAGITEKMSEKYFCKHLYKDITPYKENFSYVLKDSCSLMYIENLLDYIRKSNV
nr:hypothetical protein [Pedobacter panaciterrae]